MADEPSEEARVISITDEQRRKARRVAPAEVDTRSLARRRRAQLRERSRRSRAGEAPVRLPAEDHGIVSGVLSDPRLARWAQFLRRRLEGAYHVDEYGYDEELTEEVMLPILRPLYRSYFRVEVRGIDQVPAQGPLVLAANHSGAVPIDGLMLLVAMKEEHPARPVVRLLGNDPVWQLPFLSHWARKAGNSVDVGADALRMLQEGEILGVFPEGFKGLAKSWGDRYRLQRFGSPATFVEVALRTGAPIVPVGIVGAEETYPMLTNAKPLARLLGLPYFPVTPLFPLLGPAGLAPLPSKWIIEFGEPIDTAHYGADSAADPMTVFDVADGVRDTIQQLLYRNLVKRRAWFW